MPPKKIVHRPKPPASEAQSIVALVALIRSIPSQIDDWSQDSSEPPAKRAKLTQTSAASRDALCIAREDLTLPSRKAAVSPESCCITRQNVGAFLDLSLRKSGLGLEGQRTLILSIHPRSKSANFRVDYSLYEADLPANLVSALQVVDSSSADPGEQGCLWASVDASIRQHGTSVQLSLSIEVRWNESTTFWGRPKARSQQTLRNTYMGKWFPELDLDKPTQPSSSRSPWPPQEYYQAAHVPDKEIYDPQVSSMQIRGLKANLYPFQRRAVQWLLQREGAHWSHGSETNSAGVQPYTPMSSNLLPISFVETKDVDGGVCYLSPLFGVATRDISPFLSHQNLRGGILAEEMGLGKTLEIISLILLHRRPEGPPMVFDQHRGKQLLATWATLIITPASLLDQWLSELRRHAPELKVSCYPGLKKAAQDKDKDKYSIENLATFDVVVTTYEVLRSEIWATFDEPDRAMRRGPKQSHERPKSPLVELSWWRVCIDEAQMVENWTSNAATLAQRIPRINAWAITGTPVKDDTQKDLRGLLNFLRFEPYVSDTRMWNLVATVYKDLFRSLFGMISMRHTKALVRGEIDIPNQRRYVITMPFTAVEEQHYQSLFTELAGTCGLDAHGNPLANDWDPDSPAVQAAMRTALDRLRQTALHPEVGSRSRRALGQKVGPMQTVEEVLDAMVEQSDGAMRTDQRNLLTLMLTKGQILAGLGHDNVTKAREIWEQVRAKSEEMVKECRDQLEHEVQAAREAETPEVDNNTDDGTDDDEDTVPPRVGEARRRLRSALEIQHRAVFFCANAYFSIKSNEDVVVPDSDEFKQLEKMEMDSYDLAKAIRKDILQEAHGKAKAFMERLASSAREQKFAVIPESNTTAAPNGIESRRVADGLEALCGALDDQANQLDEWRETIIQLLMKSLVDEDNEEITGEEYNESTQLQEDILVYLQVLKAAIADRQATINGPRNFLVEHEIKVAKRAAREGDGPSPEKFLELNKIREAVKPPYIENDTYSSLRGLISVLRSITGNLRYDAENGNARAVNELSVVSNLLKLAQSQQKQQAKAASSMEQEVDLFTYTLNARLDFYRQLQAVSDMVAEYDGPVDMIVLQAVSRQEDALRTKQATAESKHRYLLHLKATDSSSKKQDLCVICQDMFTVGVLTVCGHLFCKECITLWFRAKRNCPVCKRHLHQSNLHDITLKPQLLKIHSEGNDTAATYPGELPTALVKKKSTIYAEFNPDKLAEIKNIDLGNGPAYTTKVDTMIRHILWLRESDPGAKSIIFSQYKEFLDVLASAFRRYHIGSTSFEKAHGITTFKQDPGTEVFLLHARAHASGLNLVNASHVFLCEPLLNTALELQAIARVDRIGQQHETTVWLYIVDGTVEESIYNLSVQRRLKHMGRNNSLKNKSKESTPELLDASLDMANSLELQQAQQSKLFGKNGISGEVVDKKDLWTCLFGAAAARARLGEAASASISAEQERQLVDDPVTRGFLAAEAAEGRLEEAVYREDDEEGTPA
ncbi:SNF2 family N-terminal domain-containing protein [Bombardia bombarda]|uniref:SNF2 family N-terminal domain-containing protein n=1 Tax=Bombardia bombarda TaxID=252184 RepID=A0AA40CFD2_9PEZI|nr:SNF2 family N-terminal domain-containing protein [Bombardia bombarda]